jgi:hypothetical protein
LPKIPTKLPIQLYLADWRQQCHQGYVLPLVTVLGIAVMIMGLTAAMVVQTDRTTSVSRRQTGISLAMAEGAADRLMLELSRRNNSILLSRNYDPINPRTGQTYLGPDGTPNSGDESAVALNEWTGYDPSTSPCYQQAGVGALP